MSFGANAVGMRDLEVIVSAVCFSVAPWNPAARTP